MPHRHTLRRSPGAEHVRYSAAGIGKTVIAGFKFRTKEAITTHCSHPALPLQSALQLPQASA